MSSALGRAVARCADCVDLPHRSMPSKRMKAPRREAERADMAVMRPVRIQLSTRGSRDGCDHGTPTTL